METWNETKPVCVECSWLKVVNLSLGNGIAQKNVFYFMIIMTLYGVQPLSMARKTGILHQTPTELEIFYHF